MTAEHKDKDDHAETLKDFHDAVNMTAGEIGKWLETEDSKAVGWVNEGSTESVGHHSGRHIVDILGKKQADLSDADYAHMRKVVAYVRRHSAQRPDGDVSETRWRYSLMNWGNDPLKRKTRKG